MLDDYEADHNTGMDTCLISKLIYDYTSGYPFLVSKICKLLDESKELADKVSSSVWSEYGVDEAVRMLTREDGVALFESLSGKLTNYPDMKRVLYSILMEGKQITYNSLQNSIAQMKMYGFIKDDNGRVAVSNRIFETVLYNIYNGRGNEEQCVYG